jgi:putative FmdB family regulatory protein
MANYDYYCPQCDLMKEVTHPMSESPEIFCDKCQTKMKIAITSANFILEGLGWASKGTATHNKPKVTKEIGVAVPESMSGIVDEKKVIGKRRAKISQKGIAQP